MSRTRAVALTTGLGAVAWIGASVLPSAAQEPPRTSAGGVLDASAGQVRCGDTVTTDTTLDSDLLDCPSNGIGDRRRRHHPGSQRSHGLRERRDVRVMR